MKAKRDICIAPHGGQWAIRREGEGRILHVMACAEDAKELAFDVARHEGVRVWLQHAEESNDPAAILALQGFPASSWSPLLLHSP